MGQRNTKGKGKGSSTEFGGTMWGLLSARPMRRMASNVGHKVLKSPTYVVSRFRRRDQRVWVFGSHKGFRDSPRYLAEFLLHSEVDATPWWIARSQDEAELARAAGIEVALFGSAQAERIQRSAAVAFYCNSFRDLSLSLVSGALLVHLYHGTPMKRISLDVDRSRFTGRSRALRLLSAVNRWSLARKYGLIHIFVASGELARRRYVTAFGASPERVIALGTPRFDVIRGGPDYERVAGADLRARLGYGAQDRIVLWLPTWREQGDAAWLPPLAGSELDDILGDTKVMLLVKTHPFADRTVYEERLPEHARVRLLHETDVDVNCLMHIADVLVTDYSSAAFDFSILGRPIHFLAPDVEVYGAGRDLYEPYESLTGGMHHREWRPLLAALQAGSGDEHASEGHNLARRVADYCQNNTEPEVCRRLVETIEERLPPRRRSAQAQPR